MISEVSARRDEREALPDERLEGPRGGRIDHGMHDSAAVWHTTGR
jgi:hypothetical protein